MNPAEVAEKAGTSPAYVWRVIQGKQRPNARLMPYLNLLDGRSREMYFSQRKEATWADHIDVLQKLDKLVAYHHQTPLEIAIDIPTDKPIALCFTADWQLGQPGLDYDSFKRDVQTWRKTDGLWVCPGGDGYENIIQPSKVGSGHNQGPICVQKALYVLTLKELAHRIAFIGTGNHNYWTTLMDGEDWDAELAQRIKLIYTKHGARIYLKVGKITYPILRMHKGRFNSSFNLTHTCKQYQRVHFPESRIIVVEHQHVGAVEQYRYNEAECCAIRTGTYATYDDFALSNGFYGNHVCNPTVVLYPDRDHMVPFKTHQDALLYLKAVRGE